MAKTFAEKRAEIKERTGSVILTPAGMVNKESQLAQEAKAIQEAIEAGMAPDDGPTPSQEAEQEMVNEKHSLLVDQTGQPLKPKDTPVRPSPEDFEAQAATFKALAAKARAKQEAEEKQKQVEAAFHDRALVGVVASAYADFLRRGIDPERAASLTLAYVVTELAMVMKGMSGR